MQGGTTPRLPPPPAGLAARFRERIAGAAATGAPADDAGGIHAASGRSISRGETVLVALSGGLDSVALLHLLRSLPPQLRPHLAAAHFDHRMRAGSAGDASWVAGLCRAWGVPLERGVAPRPPASEAEARTLRYAFLRTAAARVRATLIATAHQADDQAETVLFRALRGAGLGGLAGIAPRRGNLVRPLLPFTRAELESYARSIGLRWREDPSNRDRRYARNRLRLDVLPALESTVPGMAAALVGVADAARNAELGWQALLHAVERDVVTTIAEGRTEVARDRILAYHPRVRARCLRRLLRRHGCAPDRAGTRAALEFISSGGSGGAVTLSGGVRIEREFDRIRIHGKDAAPAAPDRPLVIAGAAEGQGTAVVGSRLFVVRWRLSSRPGDGPGCRAFDVDALRFPVELRGWRPGDRIRFPYGTKKLKKLFLERRVGRTERRRIPVLAQSDGDVLWVVGLASAPRAPSASGRWFLRITVRDARHG